MLNWIEFVIFCSYLKEKQTKLCDKSFSKFFVSINLQLPQDQPIKDVWIDLCNDPKEWIDLEFWHFLEQENHHYYAITVQPKGKEFRCSTKSLDFKIIDMFNLITADFSMKPSFFIDIARSSRHWCRRRRHRCCRWWAPLIWTARTIRSDQ